MFHFVLVSLSGKKFDGDVHDVVLPTLSGEIGVFENHMPLVSVASNGAISIRHKAGDPDSQREHFAINGGAVEISDNTLSILVDEADHADELNEAEVKKALELARKMKAEAKDEISLEHAQSLVDRHEVRLHVAGLKRHHQSSKRKH